MILQFLDNSKQWNFEKLDYKHLIDFGITVCNTNNMQPFIFYYTGYIESATLNLYNLCYKNPFEYTTTLIQNVNSWLQITYLNDKKITCFAYFANQLILNAEAGYYFYLLEFSDRKFKSEIFKYTGGIVLPIYLQQANGVDLILQSDAVGKIEVFK